MISVKLKIALLLKEETTHNIIITKTEEKRMDIGISDEWMGGMGDHFHCRHLHEYMKKR